jgi:hypothetical protein
MLTVVAQSFRFLLKKINVRYNSTNGRLHNIENFCLRCTYTFQKYNYYYQGTLKRITVRWAVSNSTEPAAIRLIGLSTTNGISWRSQDVSYQFYHVKTIVSFCPRKTDKDRQNVPTSYWKVSINWQCNKYNLCNFCLWTYETVIKSNKWCEIVVRFVVKHEYDYEKRANVY